MRKTRMKQHKGERITSPKNPETYHLSEAIYIAEAYRMFPGQVVDLINEYGQYDPLTVNVTFLAGRYKAPIEEAKEIYLAALKPIIEGKRVLSQLDKDEIAAADLILTTLAQEDHAEKAMGLRNTEHTLDALITRLNMPKIRNDF